MTSNAIHFGKPASGAKAKGPGSARHDALVKQSQKWVSQTFFGAMLKEMRNSPFKDKMFSGGRGGEAFSEMFDQQLADRMGRGSGTKLVNALVRKMEGPQGAKAAASARAKAPSVSAALRAYNQSQLSDGAK